MTSIQAYVESKKQADEQKRQQDEANRNQGLGGLLNALIGGVGGFFTGGPVGALVGAGGALLSSATKGNVQAKDVQSAYQKFQDWKKSQTPEQPTSLNSQPFGTPAPNFGSGGDPNTLGTGLPPWWTPDWLGGNK